MNKLKSAVFLAESEMKNVMGGGSEDFLADAGGRIIVDEGEGNMSARYSEKERACLGKSLCEPCSWSTKYNQTIYGSCSQNGFTPNRYCSDVRCHY